MIRAIAMLAVLLAAGAARADSLADQYKAAAHGFMAGVLDPAAYQRGYFKAISQGLEGRWTQISTLFPGAEMPADSASLLKTACEKNGADLRVDSAYQFSMTRTPKSGTLRFVYTLVVGNMFGEYVDPVQFLGYLGLDEDRLAATGMNPLSNANGIATVARPTPDILVIQSNYRQPRIYGRCP